MVYGRPVYNTEQRRKALRQMKKYFDKQWLKKKIAGTLPKRKIILPNARKKYYKIKIKIVKRRRRKRKRK